MARRMMSKTSMTKHPKGWKATYNTGGKRYSDVFHSRNEASGWMNNLMFNDSDLKLGTPTRIPSDTTQLSRMTRESRGK